MRRKRWYRMWVLCLTFAYGYYFGKHTGGRYVEYTDN